MRGAAGEDSSMESSENEDVNCRNTHGHAQAQRWPRTKKDEENAQLELHGPKMIEILFFMILLHGVVY